MCSGLPRTSSRKPRLRARKPRRLPMREAGERDKMSHTGREAYLEGRILSADPLELLRMLIPRLQRRGAGGAAAAGGRRHRGAFEVDYEGPRDSGGAVALARPAAWRRDRRTAGAAFYDYMQTRLIEANCRQEDAPLAEVLGLLATLGEAWEGVEEQTRRAAVRRRVPGSSRPRRSRSWRRRTPGVSSGLRSLTIGRCDDWDGSGCGSRSARRRTGSGS